MDDEIVGRASPVRPGVPKSEVSPLPLGDARADRLAAVFARVGHAA